MRGMQQQLGNWGTISAFACRHKETKKNLCRQEKPSYQKLYTVLSSLGVVFLMCILVKCICLVCIVVILCVFVVPYMYLLYLLCICCILYVFVVSYVYLLYLICICFIICIFVAPYMYLQYLMCICCTLYVFFVSYVYLLYLTYICCILCVFVVSYMYLLYYMCYFRCRTAGQKSVSGRSCDRPPRHRFFLVSLCLQANAEIVPKFPSCYYMLLMQPSRLKFPSYFFFFFSYLCTCKITTATV